MKPSFEKFLSLKLLLWSVNCEKERGKPKSVIEQNAKGFLTAGVER
jgi:hypothetical protein